MPNLYTSSFYNSKNVSAIRRSRRNKFKKTYPIVNYGLNQVKRAVPRLENHVRLLKEVVNTEFKYLDTDQTATFNITPSAISSKFLLNGLQHGDIAVTRNGESIRIKSIEINYSLLFNATANYSHVRVLVVVDKQANAAAPALSDVLAQGGTLSTNIYSPRNLYNKKRFFSLHDQTYVLNQDAQPMVHNRYYRKMDMHTVYNGGDAGTIADITSNSIYVFIFSDESTNYPAGNLYGRIRFVDN